MLQQENGQVQLAQRQLAQVFGFLSGDRQSLAGALNQLATALGEVKSFIGSNRTLIKSNVTKLASITKTLVNERASLAQAIDELPLDVDNVLGAYNPATHSLDGRGNLRELEPAGTFGTTAASSSSSGGNVFCQAAGTSGSRQNPLGSLCRQEHHPASAAGQLVPVSAEQQAALPPLPLPPAGTVYGSAGTVQGKGR
jgi:phospholipid/cholesterol/gamma-HCH transport system substrate-binding protein